MSGGADANAEWAVWNVLAIVEDVDGVESGGDGSIFGAVHVVVDHFEERLDGVLAAFLVDDYDIGFSFTGT